MVREKAMPRELLGRQIVRPIVIHHIWAFFSIISQSEARNELF